MITAVDSSVLLDILVSDKTYGQRSASLLRMCLADGTVIACDVVWAEVGANFGKSEQFAETMAKLAVLFSPIDEKAAFRSSRAWRRYHERGGRRERVIADFLIGAHAFMQADRLLTRDRGFYRDYFSGLRVLDPSAQ